MNDDQTSTTPVVHLLNINPRSTDPGRAWCGPLGPGDDYCRASGNATCPMCLELYSMNERTKGLHALARSDQAQARAGELLGAHAWRDATAIEPGHNPRLLSLLCMVAAERYRQDALWGADRHHPCTSPEPEDFAIVRRMTTTDGGVCLALGPYGVPTHQFVRSILRALAADSPERVTWAMIALEEFGEVLQAGSDQDRLDELVQLAAVCLAWAQDLQDHGQAGSHVPPAGPLRKRRKGAPR